MPYLRWSGVVRRSLTVLLHVQFVVDFGDGLLLRQELARWYRERRTGVDGQAVMFKIVRTVHIYSYCRGVNKVVAVFPLFAHYCEAPTAREFSGIFRETSSEACSGTDGLNALGVV